jgi:hypothetical protein
MASQEKLRAVIAELINRPKNVDYEEIAWVLTQLGSGPPRKTRHLLLFKIPGCTEKLALNQHNNGKPHLPPYCVAEFRDRMMELGLYP